MYEVTSVSLTDLVSDLIERSPRARTAIRAAAGQSGTPYPIRVVEGDAAPQLAGESWGYRTRGGRVIRHPSSYARRGWSSMVYSPSTHHITVGAEWAGRTLTRAPSAVALCGAGI